MNVKKLAQLDTTWKILPELVTNVTHLVLTVMENIVGNAYHLVDQDISCTKILANHLVHLIPMKIEKKDYAHHVVDNVLNVTVQDVMEIV